MIAYVGLGMIGITIILSLSNLITNVTTNILVIIGVLLGLLPLLFKPKFEKRKLVKTYNVLPIVPGVYGIKTCDGKVIFKYLDFEEENKVLIDTLSSWNEIEEINGNSQPMLSVYEQKAKKSWLTLSDVETRYIEVLKIPKNSIITK